MRMRRLIAVVSHVLAFLLAGSCAWSQPIGMPPPIERRAPPRLMISTPVETPVRIESVKIRTEVSGSLAQTEVAMVFRNPNARVLEGELKFPLLDGQTITGFAMDVNGALRDAVPVDKTRGQAIFEEIIRGQIDPGLLQATEGNNFKLRVYPIPAQGAKQVVLRYTESLVERNDRFIYRLPLEYGDRLDDFLLDLKVRAGAAAPIVKPSALGSFALVSEGTFVTARVARAQFAGRGFLELEIAREPQSQVYTQTFEGRTWFFAEVPVSSRQAQRTLPRKLGIVWDSSGSGANRDRTRELALLDAYLRQMRNGDVRLTRIRDTAEPVETFRVVDGDWRTLRAALESTPYDGATNLSAFTPQPGVQEYLLFTDGLANYGDAPLPKSRVPLFTISSATRTNPAWLRHVAEQSGGGYIDLTADDAAAALAKLTVAGTRVREMAADGAGQLLIASPFPERGRIRLAGELLRSDAVLKLRLEHPDKTETISNVTFASRRSESRLAAQLWARMRLAALEPEYERNREEIRQVGKRFGLVTRETSLIVLDRVEDYARHEITPPPELLAEYARVRRAIVDQRESDRSRHLADIVRRFEEKVSWWNRDFPKDKRTPAKTDAKIAAGAGLSRELRSDRARREEPLKAAAPTALQEAAPRADAVPASALRAATERSGDAASRDSTAIRLAPWEPNAPYMARLRNAEAGQAYRHYLDERPKHLASTAFFLDAADVLFSKGQAALALRVLSNLAETDLENRHILRILGYRLLQADQAKAAVTVFRKVLALSPEEPQSYRDLGLALSAAGQSQDAINMLYEVVSRPWHNRFPDIELIALAELNAVVATSRTALDTMRIHPRLLRNLPLDLRVALTWDADNTDIDLWVTDPDGEKAYYGNRLTYQGARMSMDFTGGYGPEEFALKHAKPGRYRIEANYYGDRRQAITGPTTLQVKLTTKFGTFEQQEKLVTLRLSGRSEVVFVGEFEVGSGNGH